MYVMVLNILIYAHDALMVMLYCPDGYALLLQDVGTEVFHENHSAGSSRMVGGAER